MLAYMIQYSPQFFSEFKYVLITLECSFLVNFECLKEPRVGGSQIQLVQLLFFHLELFLTMVCHSSWFSFRVSSDWFAIKISQTNKLTDYFSAAESQAGWSSGSEVLYLLWPLPSFSHILTVGQVIQSKR